MQRSQPVKCETILSSLISLHRCTTREKKNVNRMKSLIGKIVVDAHHSLCHRIKWLHVLHTFRINTGKSTVHRIFVAIMAFGNSGIVIYARCNITVFIIMLFIIWLSFGKNSTWTKRAKSATIYVFLPSSTEQNTDKKKLFHTDDIILAAWNNCSI